MGPLPCLRISPERAESSSCKGAFSCRPGEAAPITPKQFGNCPSVFSRGRKELAVAARRRLAVVKLQPWGGELPAILLIALSHRGGRARKAPPGRGDSGQAAGAARGLSLSCWCWLSLMGEAFPGRAPSSEGFCAGERGTGFVVNDVEGARQPSQGCAVASPRRRIRRRCRSSWRLRASAGAEDEELNGGFSGKWKTPPKRLQPCASAANNLRNSPAGLS